MQVWDSRVARGSAAAKVSQMLREFLIENHAELAARCQAKVATRMPHGDTRAVTTRAKDHGIPLLIEQLIETLRSGSEPPILMPDIATSATHHGGDLLRAGFTVEQVVRCYGDLCQALTELASERGEPITVDEFHTFNRCLDSAMAEAVTGFIRGRDRDAVQASAETTNERLGSLAHQLGKQLNTVVLAFQAIKSGSVTIGGATGKLLERSLDGLRELIDRSLADVRLTAGMLPQHAPIAIDDLIAEARVAIAIHAAGHSVTMSTAIAPGLVVHADRQMLASALANLLQNAVTYTRPGNPILLSVEEVGDRIAIRVQDGCGGLAAGTLERMFRPFARNDDHRAGLGLGLSISRRAVEANGGTLEVRDVAGVGCIFTIDLPRPSLVS